MIFCDEFEHTIFQELLLTLVHITMCWVDGVIGSEKYTEDHNQIPHLKWLMWLLCTCRPQQTPMIDRKITAAVHSPCLFKSLHKKQEFFSPSPFEICLDILSPLWFSVCLSLTEEDKMPENEMSESRKKYKDLPWIVRNTGDLWPPEETRRGQ